MPPIRILAIDPGWQRAATAHLLVSQVGPSVLATDEWPLPRKRRAEARHDYDHRVVRDLSHWLWRKLTTPQWDYVVIEAYNRLLGKRAAFSMGLSWSPAIALAVARGLQTLPVGAQQVRELLKLPIAASKDRCYSTAVARLASAPTDPPDSEHRRDAVAIGVAGLELPAIRVTLAREGLAKCP